MNAWECNHAVVVFQWVDFVFLSFFLSSILFCLKSFMLGTVHCSEYVQSSLVFVFCFIFILKFEWVYGNMFVVVFDGLNLKLFAELTVMGWITVFCRMKEKFYYVMCVHWTVFAATASAATTTTADIHTLYKNYCTKTNLQSNLKEKGRQHKMFIG